MMIEKVNDIRISNDHVELKASFYSKDVVLMKCAYLLEPKNDKEIIEFLSLKDPAIKEEPLKDGRIKYTQKIKIPSTVLKSLVESFHFDGTEEGSYFEAEEEQ